MQRWHRRNRLLPWKPSHSQNTRFVEFTKLPAAKPQLHVLKKQLLITQQKLNHFKLKANLGKAILSSRLCFVQLFSFRGDSKMPKPQKSTSAYIYLIFQCYYWLRVLCDRVVFSSSPLSLSGSLKLKSKNKVESRT